MTDRFWAIVPAAGTSSRFGGDTVKQYKLLAGKPILAHSLESLLDDARIEGVIVALAKDDSEFDGLMQKYQIHSRVHLAQGGETRAESVYNALERLAGLAKPNDYVLVHDAARPLLHRDDLDNLINSLQGHPTGGVLAGAVVDTLKRASVSDKGSTDSVLPEIIKTESREVFWRAQTPQMFRYRRLLDAIESGLSKPETIVTDESMAMEQQGFHPVIVPSRYMNFKITYPQDLMLAEIILGARAQGQLV